MQDWSLDHLLFFFAGWWLFATVTAFLAAALFWNKGASQLTGAAPGMSGLAVKFTGAGAIWGFTLLLFFFVNPLRAYTDVHGLLLVCTRERPAPRVPRGVADVSIMAKRFEGLDLSGDDNVELIPSDSIFTLIPDENNRFSYHQPIPVGMYQIRVTNSRTGHQTTRGLMLSLQRSEQLTSKEAP